MKNHTPLVLVTRLYIFVFQITAKRRLAMDLVVILPLPTLLLRLTISLCWLGCNSIWWRNLLILFLDAWT